MEAGLSIVLVCAAVAALPIAHPEYSIPAMALAGVCALLAVLYASYRMAFIDALSGLPNRRALDEALARLSGSFRRRDDRHRSLQALSTTRTDMPPATLVLKAIGPQLRKIRGGRAYRYGGEEFCVLFSGAQSRGAAAALEAARLRIEQGQGADSLGAAAAQAHPGGQAQRSQRRAGDDQRRIGRPRRHRARAARSAQGGRPGAVPGQGERAELLGRRLTRESRPPRPVRETCDDPTIPQAS
jgi:GGDEF domain-containing protein